MALYTELDIYPPAKGLFAVVAEFVIHMPKPEREMFGKLLRDFSLEIVVSIGRTNSARQKVPHLDALIELVRKTELTLRVCKQHRYISKSHYARAIKCSTSVAMQAQGWRNFCDKSPAA